MSGDSTTPVGDRAFDPVGTILLWDCDFVDDPVGDSDNNAAVRKARRRAAWEAAAAWAEATRVWKKASMAAPEVLVAVRVAVRAADRENPTADKSWTSPEALGAITASAARAAARLV